MHDALDAERSAIAVVASTAATSQGVNTARRRIPHAAVSQREALHEDSKMREEQDVEHAKIVRGADRLRRDRSFGHGSDVLENKQEI